MSREKRNHWLSVILVNVIILILMHFLWPVCLLVPILSALVMLLVLYVTVKFIMSLTTRRKAKGSKQKARPPALWQTRLFPIGIADCTAITGPAARPAQ